MRLVGDDLDSAARGLWDPPIPGPVCFHAQQAAEKALKAYLAWLSDRRIPRTHNLRALTEAVRAQGGDAPPEDAVAALSDYATDVRYPDEPRIPTAQEAREAMALAREVVSFVCERIGSPIPGRETADGADRSGDDRAVT